MMDDKEIMHEIRTRLDTVKTTFNKTKNCSPVDWILQYERD